MGLISDPVEVDPIAVGRKALQALDVATSSVPSFTTPTPEGATVFPADPVAPEAPVVESAPAPEPPEAA